MIYTLREPMLNCKTCQMNEQDIHFKRITVFGNKIKQETYTEEFLPIIVVV